MIDLWFTAGRSASQDLLGRLGARERDLRALVESGGGRVPAGPGDPSELRWATPSEGAVQARQALRACISILAQGRGGGEGV